MNYRVAIDTKLGTINAGIHELAGQFVATIDRTEYPDFPVGQAPAAGEPPATTLDEAAVEAMRRAINSIP